VEEEGPELTWKEVTALAPTVASTRRDKATMA